MRDKMHRWKVRDGDEGDLHQILKLRSAVFGEMEKDKLDPRFWRWEFMGGTEGKALIHIVEEGDEIVGHFADIPRKFFINGEVSLGTLSLDLMVHPDYRRKGMFYQLGRYAVQRVRESGGRFMTAYPIRKETIKGLKKIGWVVVDDLPVLVFPLRFQGIFQRYLHFLPLSLFMGGMARVFYHLLFRKKKELKEGKIRIEEVLEVDSWFERFLEETKFHFSHMGLRDRMYLIWRYFKHPTRTYRIFRAIKREEMRGFIVLRKVDLLGFNSAVIVDLMALDEEALTPLAEEGIAYSQREQVDLLGFMVPKSHPYYHFLKKQGFLRSPKTFQFMIYSHQDDKKQFAPSQWYVNWGDTDVI
jgi:GNAT superfamily N-acetyltransferase